MKKVSWLIGLGLVIIAGCMLYLLRHGVSLRSAPLIQPSAADPDLKNVAVSVAQRLHQPFEEAHYTVIGILPETEESGHILRMMADEYEKMFRRPVRLLEKNAALTPELLRACESPCWILTGRDEAHALGENTFLTRELAPLERNYFTLSFVDFTGDEAVSEECDRQRRLDFGCLVPVAVREVRRRMKSPLRRYFFLRQYNDRDYFLFLQAPALPGKAPAPILED